ncbi:hypothetical protein [Pararhizobium qamdonense]|uniref:hypothetical protein n=1 Tax=Pararhizobium qamdonense TaxID=3031126 RepID=UPI0023E0C1D4|nr:hypothetical protein [Pararhizobium qamdonense]
MTIESRRATIQKLIDFEGIAGRPIADDADFLSLAERWVNHEIDMPEMRRLYQAVRDERRKRKLYPVPTAESFPIEPRPSSDEAPSEIDRITRCDFNE